MSTARPDRGPIRPGKGSTHPPPSSPSSGPPPRSSLSAFAASQARTSRCWSSRWSCTGSATPSTAGSPACVTARPAPAPCSTSCATGCASAAFYVGLAWLEPHLAPAIFVYLADVHGRRLLPFDSASLPGRSPAPTTSTSSTAGCGCGTGRTPARPSTRACSRSCCSSPAGCGSDSPSRWPCSRTRAIPLASLLRLGMPHPRAAALRGGAFGMDLIRSFTGREVRPVACEAGPHHAGRGLRFGGAAVRQHRGLPGAVGAAIRDVGVWEVAAAAAIGQTAGKVGLYYAADWAMRLPWIRKKMATPKWSDVLRALADLDRRAPQRAPSALLFASASRRLPAALRDGRARGSAAREHLALREHLPGRSLPSGSWCCSARPTGSSYG